MISLNVHADLFVPNGDDPNTIIPKTTHMAIAAHQDDIEIMAYDGILKCFHNKEYSFFGVVVTDGAGSSRIGPYGAYTNEEMAEIRKAEQRKAAVIGEYGALAQLNYPSSTIKDPNDLECIDDLTHLIKFAKPDVIYTHNLADKHDTHIGVAVKVIKAIRSLSEDERPKSLYGCEVWRNLDWLQDEDKVVFDVSDQPKLAQDLIEVFDSQISGGKRYDAATLGRRLANATYHQSHQSDLGNALIFAMDMTPLIQDDTLDITRYVLSYIDRFKNDVERKIKSQISK